MMAPRLRLVLPACALLVGCIDRTKPDPADTGADMGSSGGSVVESSSPDISLSTSRMDFSGSPLSEASVRTLTITNEGDEDLLLRELVIEGDRAFQVGNPEAIRLGAGASTTVPVSFMPTTIDVRVGQIGVSSNDPDEPELWVELVGSGTGPLITTDTERQLGPVGLGCTDTGTVTVANVGTEPVQVTGASVAAPFFVDSADFPMSLAPGAEASVAVSFAPTVAVPEVTELLVVQSDAGEQAVVLRGSTLDQAVTRDVFVAGNSTTDILFAVDRSCSMADDVQGLWDAMPTFTAELDARGADWRVSVTVDDDGCINGNDLFIDASLSPSDVRAVAMDMLALGSSYASNTERAFTLMDASLARTGAGDCNEGLIRSTATLNLVGVSDEEEQSVEPYGTFVASFQALKTDPADLAMHAIGPVAGTCGSPSGTGFEDAAAATGGSMYSICDDLEANLVDLAGALVLSESSTYTLSSTPVPDTLGVTVDGVGDTRWTFEPATGSVVFDPDSLPPDGAEVVIEYVEDTCP